MKPIVVGFHGCDREVALAVVTGKTRLTPSRNAFDWLGHGIYFWEDDRMRALEWAAPKTSRRKRPNFARAVLGAVVDLTNCLNLVETEAYALVAEAFEALKAHCEAIGQPLPTNGGFLEGARYLDCSFLRWFMTFVIGKACQPTVPFEHSFLKERLSFPVQASASATTSRYAFEIPPASSGIF